MPAAAPWETSRASARVLAVGPAQGARVSVLRSLGLRLERRPASASSPAAGQIGGAFGSTLHSHDEARPLCTRRCPTAWVEDAEAARDRSDRARVPRWRWPRDDARGRVRINRHVGRARGVGKVPSAIRGPPRGGGPLRGRSRVEDGRRGPGWKMVVMNAVAPRAVWGEGSGIPGRVLPFDRALGKSRPGADAFVERGHLWRDATHEPMHEDVGERRGSSTSTTISSVWPGTAVQASAGDTLCSESWRGGIGPPAGNDNVVTRGTQRRVGVGPRSRAVWLPA